MLRLVSGSASSEPELAVAGFYALGTKDERLAIDRMVSPAQRAHFALEMGEERRAGYLDIQTDTSKFGGIKSTVEVGRTNSIDNGQEYFRIFRGTYCTDRNGVERTLTQEERDDFGAYIRIARFIDFAHLRPFLTRSIAFVSIASSWNVRQDEQLGARGIR